MGDMGDIFRAMREDKKARHSINKQDNIKFLIHCGHIFTSKSNGECLMFREMGYPKVDYYPSSNKWKWIKKINNKMMYGNALSFLNWYEQQNYKSKFPASGR